MKMFSIAGKNLIRHKLTSLVLVLVFAVAAFALYWIFGYSNMVVSKLFDFSHDSYGDVVFFTDFFDRQQVDKLLEAFNLHKVVYEREVRAMIDSPQKSDTVTLVELTDENITRMEPYVRPVEGKIPVAVDEIMISEFLQQGVYHVGDKLFITASTHDKIINTIAYKVVGIAKSSALKSGNGSGFMISQESMSQLVDSTLRFNLLYVFLPPGPSDQEIANTHEQIKAALEQAGINIDHSWTITQRMKLLKGFSIVATGMRYVFLALVFPLVGAVVAAFVWMHAFKRRREIWTYLAMGMRNRGVILLFVGEHWLLCLAGIGLGFGAGALTGYWSEAENVWLYFSYTFMSPLLTKIGVMDLLVISCFMLASVLIWMIPPLNRILKAKPFSY